MTLPQQALMLFINSCLHFSRHLASSPAWALIFLWAQLIAANCYFEARRDATKSWSCVPEINTLLYILVCNCTLPERSSISACSVFPVPVFFSCSRFPFPRPHYLAFSIPFTCLQLALSMPFACLAPFSCVQTGCYSCHWQICRLRVITSFHL